MILLENRYAASGIRDVNVALETVMAVPVLPVAISKRASS